MRQHVADIIRNIVLAPTDPLHMASARYNLEYIFAERANCLMAEMDMLLKMLLAYPVTDYQEVMRHARSLLKALLRYPAYVRHKEERKYGI